MREKVEKRESKRRKKIMKINFRRVNKWQQILFNFIHGNVPRLPVVWGGSARVHHSVQLFFSFSGFTLLSRFSPHTSFVSTAARSLQRLRKRRRMQTSETEVFVTQCSLFEVDLRSVDEDRAERRLRSDKKKISQMKSIHVDCDGNMEWGARRKESVDATQIFAILAFPI